MQTADSQKPNRALWWIDKVSMSGPLHEENNVTAINAGATINSVVVGVAIFNNSFVLGISSSNINKRANNVVQ